MKILLLNDFGTPTGGAELQILSLRQGLRERGHDVRLLSSQISPVANTEILADYQCFGTNTKFQVISQTVNPSAYLCLRQILHEFKPDVVHVRIFMGQLSPLILPLLKNVPCLYQAAMYRAICPTGKKILSDGTACQNQPGLACLQQKCLTPQSWSVLMVQRQLWLYWKHVFDMVVALSHGMKDKLEAEGIKPVQVVYNGVPERPPRPPLSHPPTVAYAGRLSPEKGVTVLLEAFAQVVAKIPQARLIIAGQGNEKTELVTLAEKLGISQSTVWLGHLSRTELESHFDSAWVQVIPSLWEEPFGNVTTEAMMRGTAVIASAVGAQPEIIEEGVTGLLVPPKHVEKLADTLVKLLLDPNLAEQMGQAGRQRALTHFSENRRTEHFLKLYEQLYTAYQ